MNAYTIQSNGEYHVIIAGSMSEAIQQYIKVMHKDNADDMKFVFNESDIESCAFIGEVLNYPK